MTMTTKHCFSRLAAVASLTLLAGCATERSSLPPQDSTKYTLENTENFVALDKPAQTSVTCTGLQPRTLADGRFEVVASVKNRGAGPFRLQINCVFKDEQGATCEETPFQTIALAANATEAVRFTASSPAAKKCAIRVREAR